MEKMEGCKEVWKERKGERIEEEKKGNHQL